MNTVPQLQVTLSDVALLLEQQRYDEALEILGDLMKKNPSDRETRMYRLLVVRICVLRYSLTRPTHRSAKYLGAIARVITRAASAARAFEFFKTPGSSVRSCHTVQTSPGDRHSQLQSELAEASQQLDKLTIKNKELLEEINSLSGKLAASQRTIEDLQTVQDRLSATQSANQAAKQELQEEIAELKNQLQRSEVRLSESATHAQEIAERNSKLQTEVVGLKQQVQAGQRTIEELQSEQQRLARAQSENRQLQQEIASLQNQLQRSETRLSESARQNQGAADRYARLQTEYAGLKQQLDESQTKARELEAVQDQLANLESREAILTNEKYQLQAQIADLKQEFSVGQEKVQEADATHKRLAAMEHVCQELSEENRRLEEEISRWQERLAESEEKQRQISALRKQLHELQTKQAPHIDRNQKELDGLLTIDPVGILVVNEEEIKPAVRSLRKQRSRVGIIPALVLLAIGGAVAVGLLGISSDNSSGSKEPVVASQTVSGEQSPPIEAASKTPKRPSPASATALAKNKFSKQTPRTQPAPRLRGTFEIIRATEVYNGPSENSALIASIAPGTIINVVDSRDGWLEIRSMHGRPPGFVRREAAVRIDPNQG